MNKNNLLLTIIYIVGMLCSTILVIKGHIYFAIFVLLVAFGTHTGRD